MLDISFIRENPELVQKAAKDKNLSFNVQALLEVDKKRRTLIQESEGLKAEQKKTTDREAATILKNKRKDLEKELEEVEKEFSELMVQAPTIPSPDTPIGKSEDENVEVKRVGEMPAFDFEPKDHVEIAKALDLIDFERGVKTAGYRGYYLKNEGAQLAMALMMYGFRKMMDKGYTSMIPPTLIREFALFGSGYFKGITYNADVDEIYEVASKDKEASGEISGDRKFLVGTAEPSLLAYYSGEVLKEEDLPIRMSGYSQCYRSEIGSYGKDTKGLYRVHEFMKIEQVVISKADTEESTKIQEEMLAITEEIHQDLGLPYRVLQICTGDLSAGKYRQFDYEAWLPGSKRWAETGSASNFLDWQARRLNIKYVTSTGEKKFAYLLNNTALPSPRPLIAILENYQTKDGKVRVPKVLQPFIGKEIIG